MTTSNIYSLTTDIQYLLSDKGGWMSSALSEEFASEVSTRLSGQFGPERTNPQPRLRLSQMGPKCPCALWHSIHKPEEAEKLPPWAEMKFAFGHVIEGLAISLAKASGHRVEGEQDAVSACGVVGHRDCVIDGHIVDVKSASSFSFKKFQDRSIASADTFGYLDQLDGYLLGSQDDPLVTAKDRAFLLAIDKQLGHMCLYEHRFREDSIRKRIEYYKQIIERPKPPPCECGVVAEGKSGNLRLDTKASYSPFKHSCFPQLRTFLYGTGPVYLSRVAKRPAPHILEVDKNGNIIYT